MSSHRPLMPHSSIANTSSMPGPHQYIDQHRARSWVVDASYVPSLVQGWTRCARTPQAFALTAS
eukprot:3350904-Pyramimonas_sp.AAC.1